MRQQRQPFLENILLFIQTLRQAGIPVSTEQTLSLLDAFELIAIADREQVYHACRSLLLNRMENRNLFDALFNRFWRRVSPAGGGQAMPVAPRHDVPRRPQFTVANYMAFKARYVDQELDLVDKANTYSPAEKLRQKAFADMTVEELAAVRQLMRQWRWRVSERRTRRRVPAARGDQLDLRGMMRMAVRYGGTPVRLRRRQRKVKDRPVILLADISGSMEKYTRLVLQFFYSVTHSIDQVESFLFGTRLTRVTGALKLKNIDRAVEQAARDVVDWAGGTRIGDSLQQFNRQWSRRVLRRGAVVVIVSDGWERGDVAQLGHATAFLQRRAHRLIWLNPLSGTATYRPEVAGMVQALPFIDDFLPVHNLQSLEALAHHLQQLD